jgi:hypothetical protein
MKFPSAFLHRGLPNGPNCFKQLISSLADIKVLGATIAIQTK